MKTSEDGPRREAFVRFARARRHAWATAVPVVLVNVVAFQAQLAFWSAHLPQAQAVLVSLALETVAVYLAWQAYLALTANDSALRLRLAAYGMALVIGALNYSHYMLPGWRPTVAAVTFGMMSAISPWLWAVHSRRVSRDQLKSEGLIEDHAVRLGMTRWFWHPLDCIRVQSRAAWVAENRPAEAIRMLDHSWMEQTWLDPEFDADLIAEHEPAAPQTPPSDSRSGERPTEAAADEGQAKVTGLTAARNAFERGVAWGLIQSGSPLPGRNELGRDPRLAHLGSESTRNRAAGRILADARAGLNGHGSGS